MTGIQKILQSAPGECLQGCAGALVAVLVFNIVAAVVSAFLWLIAAAAFGAAVVSWASAFWTKEDEVLSADGEWEQGDDKPKEEEELK